MPGRSLIVAGLGCRRDCPADALHDLLLSVLADQDVQAADLSALASSANKTDERAIRELGERLGLPVFYLAAEQLAAYQAGLSDSSDLVRQVSGSAGVAEACALAQAQIASGAPARLLVGKRKNAQATVALAIALL